MQIGLVLDILLFSDALLKKAPKDQLITIAAKMPKIPSSRNTWVKNKLDWFKANINNMNSMIARAQELKDNVHDKRNFVCSFPKTTRTSPVCEGTLEILQELGRDEPLKPLLVPGNGSCWAISFLMATIGRHNQLLIHEVRLSVLIYLLLNDKEIAFIAKSRGVPHDMIEDILDLTSHSKVRKRNKAKNYSVEESEGFGSWISIYCLSMVFDVKIILIYPRVGPSNIFENIFTGVLNGDSSREGFIRVRYNVIAYFIEKF